MRVRGLLKKSLSFAGHDGIVRLEFAEVTTLGEKMKKYYKLYSLMENKLFSKFGDRKYIELNKEYYAQDPHYKLCFADINHILDYIDEHGVVVCDVKPVGKVIDSILPSKVESECECIIPSNFSRIIFHPYHLAEQMDDESSM